MLNKYILVFLISSMSYLQSFDVKVLIKKNSIVDLSADPIILSSSNGFVLSDHIALSLGCLCQSDKLSISSKNGVVTINGKPLSSTKSVYISPMLSKKHVAQLKSYISCWLENYTKENDELAEPICSLFDQIVTQCKPLEQNRYDLLTSYCNEIVYLFLQDFLATITDDLAVQLPTLVDYGQQFFQQKAKNLFLESLASKHLSKQDRKCLEKDQRYRYSFFIEELHAVLQKLLYEFVPALPRKVLQQFLKEGVGHIKQGDHIYLGYFAIFQEKKNIYLINGLDIDDYLVSVVISEGWPSWTHEMNKVMAIACRTYLIWQILQAKKADRPYHIQNNISHQTYKGHDAKMAVKIKKAIDETKDLFVSFDNAPALTMYDSCCGGVVPSDIDDPGLNSYSYLRRQYPCTFCKHLKVYSWHVDIEADKMLKRLQKEFPKIVKLSEIFVSKKDKAGLAKKITIEAGSHKIVITEKKMKLLFPEILSSCFEIKHVNRKYMIVGRGYGHHRGMCQRGAGELVKNEGWNVAQVLQFYYPGTKLMKLTYQR